MKTINFKGKGEHSVNELELIIEQQAEELHLIKSGQKQLILSGVSHRREQLIDFRNWWYGNRHSANAVTNDEIDDFLGN